MFFEKCRNKFQSNRNERTVITCYLIYSILLTLTSYTCIFVVSIVAARRPVGALKDAGFIPIAGEGVNVYRSRSLTVHWSIVANGHTAIPQTLADNLCNRILDKVIMGDGSPNSIQEDFYPTLSGIWTAHKPCSWNMKSNDVKGIKVNYMYLPNLTTFIV